MIGVFDTILKEMFPGVEFEYKFHPTRKWRNILIWQTLGYIYRLIVRFVMKVIANHAQISFIVLADAIP